MSRKNPITVSSGKEEPESATEWFISHLEEEAKLLEQVLPTLKGCSVALFRIRHGAEIMAVCMGVKSFSNAAPNKLYRWSIRQHAKVIRKYPNTCPPETLARLHLFYFGRGIVKKELRRISRRSVKP
jgi:hypothetical protein